jgi:hypothetical protein
VPASTSPWTFKTRGQCYECLNTFAKSICKFAGYCMWGLFKINHNGSTTLRCQLHQAKIFFGWFQITETF